MADWYVDSGNGSPGAGTTPGNAVNALHSVFSQADPGDTIWIARRHFEAFSPATIGGPSIMKNVAGWVDDPLRIIGWPASGTTYYSSRPAAGISAGWDAHTNPSYQERAAIRIFNWVDYSLSAHPTGPTSNVIPYFCYGGLTVANMYLWHTKAGSFFNTLHARIISRIFEIDNCYLYTDGSATKRGCPTVYGEASPTVFYINCQTNGTVDHLYNANPSEAYFHNCTLTKLWSWDIQNGFNFGTRWYENCTFSQEPGQYASSVNTNIFLACTHVGNATFPTSRPNYDTLQPAYIDANYDVIPQARAGFPVLFPSASGQKGAVYNHATASINTSKIRPGSTASHSICLACNFDVDDNFQDSSHRPPRPVPMGRNGTSQFSDILEPQTDVPCWPSKPNEMFTFQGYEGVAITISFYACYTNRDFTYNTESFGGNTNDLVFRSGHHAINASYLKADGTIGLARGSWVLDGPPTANDDWRRLTVTITPDMDTPIWVYFSLFYVTNSFNGVVYDYYWEAHIDPIPEIT